MSELMFFGIVFGVLLAVAALIALYEWLTHMSADEISDYLAGCSPQTYKDQTNDR